MSDTPAGDLGGVLQIFWVRIIADGAPFAIVFDLNTAAMVSSLDVAVLVLATTKTVSLLHFLSRAH